MKRSYRSVRKFCPLVLLLGASLLAAGCAKYTAANENSNARVAASADPLTMENARRANAAFANQATTQSPVLGPVESKDFYEALTDQAPSMTDDERAAEAQRQYEKRLRDSAAASPAQAKESGHDTHAGDSTHPVDADHSKKEPVPSSAPSAQDNAGLTKPTEDAAKQKSRTESNATSNHSPKDASDGARANNPVSTADDAPASSAATPDSHATTHRAAPPNGESLCQNGKISLNGNAMDFSGFYNAEIPLLEAMPTAKLTAMQTRARKDAFICALLPIAVRMNMEVYSQRLEILRLMALQKSGHTLESADDTWIADMKIRYELKVSDSIIELRKRVDIVPLPMLLAQAALESGWGLSRATHDLKNLFGIHASGNQDCAYGYDTHHACVRRFPTIIAGVSEYIRLLNTGTHYTLFRESRAEMRSTNVALDSDKLVGELGSYNENPTAYVTNIRDMMSKWNNLLQYKFNEQIASANAAPAH